MPIDAKTDLSDVIKPINLARGLPNSHYIDDAVFAEERHSVLFHNWSAVGFAKDVAQKGDAKPIDFLGMPLLMLRDGAGAVRVYQNTCRHRGMILVSEPGNIRGTIRCPYHSWCYGLNGELRATPHVGGPGHNVHKDIVRDDLGLVPIAAHVWQDVVFVNVSGEAPAFAEVHADLLDRWAEFAQPIFHAGSDSSFSLDVACNWKLAVENYCESYHLPWVHPGLNSYSRLEDHYHIEKAGEYSGQGTHVYRQLTGQDGQKFPDFDGLSEKWNTAAEYVAVYPNLLLGVHRDHAFAIILEALDTQNTREHVEIYYPQQSTAGPEFAALRGRNTAQWRAVFEEDVFVVEGMQKGRHGPFFDGGRFSPVMDGPTHLFHKWVAEQINAGREARRAR
jgi:phenylpropionate dioxygenase-like ring-hydroxylating dioxygenase large terminal subunit